MASTGAAIYAVKKGDVTVALRLKSAAAAADLIQEIRHIRDWTEMGVHLSPFFLPVEKQQSEMPGRVMEMLRAGEEFRTAIRRVTG